MNKYQEALYKIVGSSNLYPSDGKIDLIQELVDRATPMEVRGVECPECEADISFEMGLPYFCWKCGQAFIREEE